MRSVRSALILATLALATIALAPGTGRAGQVAFEFNNVPRTIRACQLVLPADARSAQPYVLPLLNRSEYKPAGWTFVNPLAPPQVNADMWGRWGAAYWTGRGVAAIGAGLGAAVPPEWPQYWEVVLNDDSADQLEQFDLIYLAPMSPLVVTTEAQRRALLRAVENGATLWIDYQGAGMNNFPVPRNRLGVRPFTFSAGTGALSADFGHPLLNSPWRLTNDEVAWLGNGVAGGMQVTFAVSNTVPFAPVVSHGTAITVAVGRYGDGAVVITSEAVGAMVEDWYDNLAPWMVPPLAAEPTWAERANLKLAFNIAGVARAGGQPGGGPSQRSVSLTSVRAPLDLAWQFPRPGGDASLPSVPGPIWGSPIVHNGYVYALSAAGVRNHTPALWRIQPQPGTRNGYTLSWAQAATGGFTPRATSPAIAELPIGGVNATAVVLASYVDPSAGTGKIEARLAATGALVWNYDVPPFRGSSRVVAISSPVVYKDWVFALITEDDGGVAYGRVLALDAATGTTSWLYPDESRGEAEQLLPPIHRLSWALDPARAELPPDGDVRPAVVTSLRTPQGTPVEAALVFSTGGVCVAGAGATINTVGGTAEYAVVPTPLNASGGAWLNAEYYRVLLANPAATLLTSPAIRNDGGGAGSPTLGLDTAPFPFGVYQYANFSNVNDVLVHLATLSTGSATDYLNPLRLQLGVLLGIKDDTVATPVTYFLPGPVAWRRTLTAGHTAEAGGRAIATGIDGVTVTESESGKQRFDWRPRAELPPGWSSGNTQAAPAAEADTAYVATTVNPVGGVLKTVLHGLRTQADLTVHLGPNVADGVTMVPGGAVTVTALDGTALPSVDVDYATRTLRFAINNTADGFHADIAGKAILVDWTGSDGAHAAELHVVPRVSRWEYAPNFVRLQRYPVVYNSAASLVLRTTDGTTITGAVAGEPTQTLGANTVLPNGWVDLTDAVITDAAGATHPVAGHEIFASYTGWSDPDNRLVAVSTGGDYPPERQQVPVGLGECGGGVAVVGQTAVVGAIGTAFSGFEGDPLKTVLAATWDPLTRVVKGYLTRPAYSDDPANPQVPAVVGTPSPSGSQVYVGVTGTGAGGDTPGWVSCLTPSRTLVCDGNRLVEVTGQDRTWTLTGSQCWVYGRTAPEPKLATPFNRPAKAAVLTENSFLVVDTGNNRVIIVDRQGNQIWPLDEEGNDYYSSPARAAGGNANLALSQPADAWRFTDSANVVHTVIADTGHNRVLDVVTTYALGVQTHTVTEVTPEFVRPPWDPTHSLKLRYVRAQPIFDPANNNLIGYLCAASNVDRVVVVEAGTKAVDPDPTTTPVGGTRPWSDWSGLYDLAAGPRFPNLRHLEYFRFGDNTYVAVVAGGILPPGANRPGAAGAVDLDGVWVWQMDAAGPVPGGGPFGSVWSYTATDYATKTGAFGTVATAAGVYGKRFYPVCAKLLYPGPVFGGRVLITNYTGVVENLARENVGSTGSGLYGELFEVSGDAAKGLRDSRIIPDPLGEDWNDPLNQPTYAERY
ncbi:MAG TPA: hypothetical protein VGM19_05520 [Armatimonadota bacterium]